MSDTLLVVTCAAVIGLFAGGFYNHPSPYTVGLLAFAVAVFVGIIADRPRP